MRPLSDAACLDLWERGHSRHPVDRALLALAAALPDQPAPDQEGPADWPLGRRNQALAALYCGCFGPRLEGWLSCPQCAEKLEFSFDARTLAAADMASDAAQTVTFGKVTFRLPTTRDLAHAAAAAEPSGAVRRLLERCRLGAADHAPWSETDLEEIGERMAAADPLAETRLMFACAACGHAFAETLDIAAFLWIRVAARGRRALADVHALASAYGWTEGEILSLGEHRRAYYLELVQA